MLEVRYTFIESYLLNAETLLNERIFGGVRSIEIVATQIDRIDESSLLRLKELRSFKLIYVTLRDLFDNGLHWMQSLNPNYNLQSALSAGNLTLGDAFKLQVTLENFPTQDDELCLFRDYPHSQFILPLFLHSSFDKLEDILPCTCLIYWLFKDYPLYAHLLRNKTLIDPDLRRYLPLHCLDINPVSY